MDKLFDDSEFFSGRFSCDCLHPAHIVDISIEFQEDYKDNTLTVDFAEKYDGSAYPLFDRIKRALCLLRGKEVWGHGFLIRKDDIPEMINLLREATR